MLKIAGLDTSANPTFHCASDKELIACCEGLAASRYLFSIGGRGETGPADLMIQWQEERKISISFLKIAWSRPEEWQIREMIPGLNQWESASLDQLLTREPLTLGEK